MYVVIICPESMYMFYLIVCEIVLKLLIGFLIGLFANVLWLIC